MPGKPHDELRAMLAAYAIGALEEDERVAVEHHLERCTACRTEMAELREAATAAYSSDSEPPPGVWSRVAKAIREASAGDEGPGADGERSGGGPDVAGGQAS